MMPENEDIKLATFGGGCFWCTEAIFQQIEGVEKVTSGYSGGRWPDPSYREVKYGRSGHAEVIQVQFDPQTISYEDLLRILFATHDPTTLNQQGNDKGHQYRSIIFFRDSDQQEKAQGIIDEVSPLFEDPIVTELLPFKAFYPAEDYHQNFFEENPDQPYCQVIISPKLEKLRARYSDKLKEVSS